MGVGGIVVGVAFVEEVRGGGGRGPGTNGPARAPGHLLAVRVMAAPAVQGGCRPARIAGVREASSGAAAAAAASGPPSRFPGLDKRH